MWPRWYHRENKMLKMTASSVTPVYSSYHREGPHTKRFWWAEPPNLYDRAPPTFSAGIAWNMIRLHTKQILTGLHASLLLAAPRGVETADEHLSPHLETWGGSESCYHARTKAKNSSDVLGPKIASEAVSQHQIQKIFLGEHAPRPSWFLHLSASTSKPDQWNFVSTRLAYVSVHHCCSLCLYRIGTTVHTGP